MQQHTDPAHEVPMPASDPPRRPGSLTGLVVGAMAMGATTVCAIAVLASGWMVGSGIAGLPVLAGFALLAALVVDSPPGPRPDRETGPARPQDDRSFSVGR